MNNHYRNSIPIFVFLFAFTASPVSSQQCPGVADYERTSSGQPRLTTIYDGNFTIQALMSLTEKYNDEDCKYVSREGVVRAFAMKYAISKFNKNSEYADYAKLGLQIDDVCRKLPTTMARGIEVISFHRPNSVCRADFLKCDAKSSNEHVAVKEASALIGTAMSYTTIPLASLMSLYSIPQVSPLSSSRLLSKKELYKSFFRTIPSDSNQIQVMLDIFEHMDWNYIFAIGSDDDYGKLGVSELKKEATMRDVCITKDEYIPFQSSRTDEKVKSVVQKIKNEPKTKVVVLFLYVVGLGDKILAEAESQGVERVWLTSESWNPGAAIELSKPKYLKVKKTSVKNQTHGILSVSLKKYPMQYLLNFIEEDIKVNWDCNLWLKSYLTNKPFMCDLVNMTSDLNLICSSGKTITLAELMKDLKKLPGNLDRLIDATTALGYAIHRTIKKECGKEPCYIKKLNTKAITDEMYLTDFINEQNEIISFDAKGDPKTAHYTIENLVFNEETNLLEYVPVGNWSSNSSMGNPKIFLDKDIIQWPYWFNYSRQLTDETRAWVNATHPSSRCSDRCQKGYKVVGKSVGKCCWKCHKCTGNNRTDRIMQEECSPCGIYHYTLDNIHCIKRPIEWLKIDNAAGISVVAISALGFLCSIATCIFMFKFWPLVSVHEKSPHLLTFICILLLVTFAYGPLHVLEPTYKFCSIRNGYFFVLLMIYTSFVLTKSQAMCGNLQSYCDKFFCGNMTVTQIFVLFLFALLEIASIVAWIYLDEKQIREFRYDGIHLIEKQCEVEFTAARLVSTFIPCIILIIGTFCAFRERNADHSFYEPKFLSFSCIALCIVIVAFLPTFKYVDGMYKAVVLAFTVNVFGFTFIACFVLPKVYVGLIRNKRGIQEYPMKPGITKKEKKEQKEKKKQEREAKKNKKKKEKESDNPPTSTTMTSSFKTKSTVEEGISEMESNRDTEAALEAVNVEEKVDKEKGFTNETFEDDGEVSIAGGSPPPSYENSIREKEGEVGEEDTHNTKC